MIRGLSLTIACGNYDRTHPLFDGHVRIEGCDPIFLPLEPEEIFFRAFVHEEFDVAELSLSSYAMRCAKGKCEHHLAIQDLTPGEGAPLEATTKLC